MYKTSFNTRPIHLTGAFALLVLVLLLTACGGSGGGSSSASAPTAQKLLSDAQAAIQKVTSYHFNLKADNPGAGTGLYTIQSADGDVVTPDKLKATADVLAAGATVKVNAVSIGSKQYITNPITGAWEQQSGLIDPRTLTDPQTGIAAILGGIQNPSAPTDDSVDGTACWSTTGKLDTKYLKAIIGSDVTSNGTVDVKACIGKSDNLPYLLRFTGVVVQGDTAQTVRTFKLSKYNETVSITAPI